MKVGAMAWSERDIRAHRDYFAAKLSATKQRHDVVTAVESGKVDFILLDTRPREAFAQGHITGAWCAPIEELEALQTKLPKDKEVVTYCWGHD
jgi:rhodanese-related sulfurtransferase